MSCNVWVHSPYQVLADGLCILVASLGFEACREPTPTTELALWDLSTSSPPYPSPPSMPTLALISGREIDAVTLLQRHYRGYLTATNNAHVLKVALEAIRRGEIWADRTILTRVIDSTSGPRLTAKEQEVLHQLTRGFSNRAIGLTLGIAEGTVKMHVSRIFSKLGVTRRTELIAQQLEG